MLTKSQECINSLSPAQLRLEKEDGITGEVLIVSTRRGRNLFTKNKRKRNADLSSHAVDARILRLLEVALNLSCDRLI